MPYDIVLVNIGLNFFATAVIICVMNIGVLGSGKGSNLQAIISAVENGSLLVKIALVISDVEDAYILERARKHNIPAMFIPPGKFKTKLEPEVEKQYVSALQEAGAELICLAGFMRIIKDDFLKAFPNRIMNIHPSLLPSFRGLEAWRQALEYGVKVVGCTVHFLDPGMDTGPIILQSTVPVMPDDTPIVLHNRIQAQEHKLYPEAIKLFSEGKLQIIDRKVIIR